MREIHAYFDSMLNARNVQKLLNGVGHAGIHLDLAGSTDYEFSAELGAPDAQGVPSLPAMLARSGGRFFDVERAPLVAAGNSISGPGCTEDCRDISAKLSMKLEEKDYQEAERIIRENGGRIL